MKPTKAVALCSLFSYIIFDAAEGIQFFDGLDIGLPDPEPINQKFNNKFTSRIIGGQNANSGEYSFMVSWYQDWNYYPSCGGSLVAPNLVLSAAHCQDLQGGVRVGSHKSTGGGVTQYVKRKIVHPNYCRFCGLMNDFMILELDGDIAIAKYPPIDLNFDVNEPAPNDMLTTIGFGKPRIADELQEIRLPAISQELCYDQYPFVDEKLHICAGFTGEGQKGVCQGDSGGPLFIEERDEHGKITRATQVGVASFGRSCGHPSSSAFARVSGAEYWLKTQICSLTSGTKPSYCADLDSPGHTNYSTPHPRPVPTPPPVAAPTGYPTFPPTLSPTNDPTAVPVVQPTFRPTPFPILAQTVAPTSADCTICDDEKAPWMIDHNVDCSTITPDDTCKLYFFIKNGYCRDRCFHAGFGYPGDNCCEREDAIYPTPSPSSSPSMPSQAPTDHLTTVSFSQDCIVCDDEPISWMTTSCEESPYIRNKCNRNHNWRRNKFCQLSCYNEKLGYEGDVCCQSITGSPSKSPSLKPSVSLMPSTTVAQVMEEEENCTFCDDVGNPWMQDGGIRCNIVPTLIERKCNKNGTWRGNKYCKNTCYHSGYGYEGDVCCNSNKSF